MHIEEVKGNLCNLSFFFFVKLNSVVSKSINQKINSVIKEGLGAAWPTFRVREKKIIGCCVQYSCQKHNAFVYVHRIEAGHLIIE